VQLPILPLVMAQGHDWKMVVAVAVLEPNAKDCKAVILRDLRLGSTDTVLGIYQLVEAVRCLTRWADEKYRHWLERDVFLVLSRDDIDYDANDNLRVALCRAI
jgi:hypothetical protein